MVGLKIRTEEPTNCEGLHMILQLHMVLNTAVFIRGG